MSCVELARSFACEFVKMFVPVAKPDKAAALKELKRNTMMLALWCGVVRVIPYVLHGLQKQGVKV